MISLEKISLSALGIFLLVSLMNVDSVSALSINAESSSYQITGEQTSKPQTKPAVPKPTAIPQPAVKAPTPVRSSQKVIPKSSTQVKKQSPVDTPEEVVSVPTSSATKQAEISVLSPDMIRTIERTIAEVKYAVDGLPNIRTSLSMIAQGEVSAVHASAPSPDPRIFEFLQMMSIIAFLMFAFGLGFISAPLKR